MTELSKELIDAMMDEPPVPRDKTDRVRDMVRQARDCWLQKQQLEEQLKEIAWRIKEIEQRELPDMFDEIGVSSMTLAAEGNMPAYEATLAPYYFANIAADWPDEVRDAAFEWLEGQGHGDLVKTVITIEFGLRERDRAIAVMGVLEDHEILYSSKRAVPWNTLTKFVKEEVQAGRGMELPLNILGATVSRVVKLKQINKED